MIATDVAIIGAGIAGAGLAAEIAGDLGVTIIEQETRAGYHSTGRSAAIFVRNYGNDVIRALNGGSVAFFEDPDRAWFPNGLIRQRGVLFIANDAGLAELETLLTSAEGLRAITLEEALGLVPALRRDWLKAAAYEANAQDIDVAALHDGWLRKARSRGARLLTGASLAGARRTADGWEIETSAGTVRARIIANAAGAWADDVAVRCGLRPLGLQPMRRSIAVLPGPAAFDTAGWPAVISADETFYFKPDAGKLYVSPADETPVDAHDAFVDDMILAEGLDRFEQAIDIPVTRVERNWAGLRTFAPDRTPVAGFQGGADGFFWLAGQGGYGIQTSPALSRLAGQLIRRAPVEKGLAGVVAALSPDRFA